MRDTDWLASTDPVFLIKGIRGKFSDRKRRLFAVACCRFGWGFLTESCCRTVEVAERFADSQADPEELSAAREASHDELRPTAATDGHQRPFPHAAYAAFVTANAEALYAARQMTTTYLTADHSSAHPEEDRQRARETRYKCEIIFDIFGNPFRPSAFDPGWRTPTAVALARSTYDDRQLPDGRLDNARLAVLADALEDAGCSEAAILNHCRQGGDHVRGCWVVDLVLGKA